MGEKGASAMTSVYSSLGKKKITLLVFRCDLDECGSGLLTGSFDGWYPKAAGFPSLSQSAT
jgi:hypothetical protein